MRSGVEWSCNGMIVLINEIYMVNGIKPKKKRCTSVLLLLN